jgi:hypothetical protein
MPPVAAAALPFGLMTFSQFRWNLVMIPAYIVRSCRRYDRARKWSSRSELAIAAG